MDLFNLIYTGLNVGPETILLVVFVILVLLVISGMLNIIPKYIAPSLMTSIGILGTFWGIYIALQPLGDSLVITDTDIRNLLNGMKTAFATSLLGLAAAFVFRAIWSLSFFQKASQPPEHTDIINHLDAIKKAISEGDDASLASQIQRLQGETRVGFEHIKGLSDVIREAIVENLSTLITDIRKIIQEQLGESLEKLIKEIEEALIRQFGATFVQFNEAVQALKKWQEDYREEVEKLTEAFDQASKGISEIKKASESIPETMNSLREILKLADSQIQELNERLTAFSDMKKNAERAFPEIEGRLAKVSSIMEDSAKKIEGDFLNFSQKIEEEIQRISEEWGGNMVAIAKKCTETIESVERIRNN